MDISASLGGPLYGLQRLGNDNVALNRDGQKIYHGSDSKESAAEGIHFTACGEKER